jgi:5-(carboxyamino)imidazole ribonucleotide mutase
MLAIADEELASKLAAEKKAMADGVIAKDKALQEQIAAL